MRSQKYKITGKKNIFAKQNNIHHLSEMGNPLEALSSVVNFEMFRNTLEIKLLNNNKKNSAGARPYDVLILFKIMVLQRYFGLSDRQVEYQIVDRTSFKEFLGLDSGDKVPDEKTIWAFREELTKLGIVEDLFNEFNSYLYSKELIFNRGQIVDASFVEAPKQRNTKVENETIKADKGNELWNDKPNKKSHKDIDARWTIKNKVRYYGYKNHAKVDAKSKLIKSYAVTDASVHDSQVLKELLDASDAGQILYADSAYTGENQELIISEKKMLNAVIEKGYRNNPLTDFQKLGNRMKSKIRSRVEHVFGFMEQSMKGLVLESIGKVRAKGIIGLMNLTYNLFRFEQLERVSN